MARKRLIAPQFFTHGELYDAEVASGLPLRLAFAGLWTQADRRGVFPWKPRELKLAVLPYDNVDMASTMRALCQHQFCTYYEVDGVGYGHIPNFGRWQTFHLKEKADDRLPGPDVVGAQHVTPPSGPGTVSAPCSPRASTPVAVTGTVTITGTKVSTDVLTSADRERDTSAPVWRVTPVDLAPDPEPTPKARTRTPKPAKPPQWPEWLKPERDRLYELWRAELGQVKFEAWVVALGPVFGRPPDGVSYADLCKGYMGWLKSIAFGGNATRFASPDACAKVLVACAKACRDITDPAARGDALDMIAQGKRVAA